MTRYVAGEVAPVARDTVNDMVEGATLGVRDFWRATQLAHHPVANR
ncbi:MAG: hypothetical protein ACYC6I_10570 [Bacillota bacterium]